MSRSRGWWRYVLAPFRFFWCLRSSFGSPLVYFGSSCAPLVPLFPFFWCLWGTCGSPLVFLGPSCSPLVPFLISLGPSGVPLVLPASPKQYLVNWRASLGSPKGAPESSENAVQRKSPKTYFSDIAFSRGNITFLIVGKGSRSSPVQFRHSISWGSHRGTHASETFAPTPPGRAKRQSKDPIGEEKKRGG